MCGRFALFHDPAEVARVFRAMWDPVALARWRPAWNIAPTRPAAVVGADADGAVIHVRRFGLVPSWAKDASGAARMINARSETVHERPAFRSALARRRCIVPMSGFYEWSGPARARVPWFFSPADTGLLAAAAIWERWRPRDSAAATRPDAAEDALETFAILTKPAGDAVAAIHDRMPVLLPESAWRRWIDPAVDGRDAVAAAVLEMSPLAVRRVSPRVNDARREGADLLEAPAESP